MHILAIIRTHKQHTLHHVNFFFAYNNLLLVSYKSSRSSISSSRIIIITRQNKKNKTKASKKIFVYNVVSVCNHDFSFLCALLSYFFLQKNPLHCYAHKYENQVLLYHKNLFLLSAAAVAIQPYIFFSHIQSSQFFCQVYILLNKRSSSRRGL